MAKKKRTAADVSHTPIAARKWLDYNDIGMAALLVCAVLLAYAPAFNGALLWDDDGHVTKPELQSFHGLWRIWFDLGATQQYYPLLHSVFWLEHRLWGDAVFGYHLTNVLLHALAALLVVAIMRRLGLRGGWLAAFIFALHPVCVEAVAWISEQKSTLSTVLYLSSALVYLNFDRTRKRSLYFLAFGLFLFALLSKTVTATLPAALLVVFWWQRKRIDWKRDVLPLAPWFTAGITGGLFTAWVERRFIGADGSDFALSIAQRVLLPGRVIWFYLWKLIWPVNLTFIYPRWTVDASAWWQYLFPVGVLAARGRSARILPPASRTSRWISVLRGNVVSGFGILQRLPLHLFFRGRPFSISGEPGGYRSGGLWSDAGCGTLVQPGPGGAGIGARGIDLAPDRHLQRCPDSLPSDAGRQSRLLDGAQQSRQHLIENPRQNA